MDEGITAAALKQAIARVARAVEDAKARLCEIDSNTGDGDLGTTMALGARALAGMIDGIDEQDIGAILSKCAAAFNKAAPSTMGTLTATALLYAGRALKGKRALAPSDLLTLSRAMVKGIEERGKAKPGDKTVLDALVPAVDALEKAIGNGLSLRQASVEAAEAARSGAEATIGMKARAGRARWISERSSQHPDGGAVACRIIFETLAE